MRNIRFGFLFLVPLLILVGSILSHVSGSALGIDKYMMLKSHVDKIIPTRDGGCLLVGTYFFNNLNADLIVMKLSASGAISWKRVIGETKMLGSFEQGVDMIQRPDDTFVVVTQSRKYELNSIGKILKKEEFDGGIIRRILPSEDSGYFLAGDTQQGKLFLSKITVAGEIERTQYYSVEGSLQFNFVTPAVGGYLIGGTQTLNPNLFLFKVSSAGDIIWQKTLLLPNVHPQAPSSGGRIYLVARSSGPNPIGRLLVVRLNQMGEVLWSRRIKSENLEIEASAIGTSGSLAILGHRQVSKFTTSPFLVKLTSTGIVESFTSFPASTENNSVLIFNDHLTVLAGRFNRKTRHLDPVIIETSLTGEIPGCFSPHKLSFSVSAPRVVSGPSQILNQAAETKFSVISAQITPVRLSRVHVCP